MSSQLRGRRPASQGHRTLEKGAAEARACSPTLSPETECPHSTCWSVLALCVQVPKTGLISNAIQSRKERQVPCKPKQSSLWVRPSVSGPKQTGSPRHPDDLRHTGLKREPICSGSPVTSQPHPSLPQHSHGTSISLTAPVMLNHLKLQDSASLKDVVFPPGSRTSLSPLCSQMTPSPPTQGIAPSNTAKKGTMLLGKPFPKGARG